MARLNTMTVSFLTLLGVDFANIVLYLCRKYYYDEALKYINTRWTFDFGYNCWYIKSF